MKLSINNSILFLLAAQANILGIIGDNSAEEETLAQAKIGTFKCLYQSDFNKGTLIISESGRYKLCEDITFYPSRGESDVAEDINEAFDPNFSGPYDKNSFGLGFFAALSIAADNVVLDLNDKTIQQSKEHALMQRFFAVIELANSPFIPNAGPAQFIGEVQLKAGSNIKILGPGTIGLSSHHGIHGNNNANVVVRDVTFENFEVAAVALNNVDDLIIKDCTVTQNRHDVPVIGMFSAARFISPYGKILKDSGYSMNLRGKLTSAGDVYDRLIEGIATVYKDVTKGGGFIDKSRHAEEYDLYHNEFGVIDGPCYAFLVHGKGPAVGEFGSELSPNEDTTSSNIVIWNNSIENIKCWTNEIPADVDEKKVVTDARGSVLQFVRSSDNAPISINTDGTYKGNMVSDMQIMVAKAIRDGVLTDKPELQTVNNNIGNKIIEWAESSTVVLKPNYRCNGDSMHHVSKGMTMIRVEDAVGFGIIDNKISKVQNLSHKPYSNCSSYHAGANRENARVPQGANIRGIAIGAVSGFQSDDETAIVIKSRIYKNEISNFESEEANIIVGIDVLGDSDLVRIIENDVDFGNNSGSSFAVMRKRDFMKYIPTEKIAGGQYMPRSIIGPPDGDDEEWVTGQTPGCPFAVQGARNPHLEEDSYKSEL